MYKCLTRLLRDSRKRSFLSCSDIRGISDFFDQISNIELIEDLIQIAGRIRNSTKPSLELAKASKSVDLRASRADASPANLLTQARWLSMWPLGNQMGTPLMLLSNLEKELNVTITRRCFIAGFGAAATSIIPLLTHPIQQEVKSAERDVLYAMDYTGDGVYQLSLNMKHDYHPDFHMTCREFADRFMDGWAAASAWCFEELSPNDSIDYDWAFEYWLRHNSGSAQAYHFLSSIDLELGKQVDSTEQGWIAFVDGPCPGNDSLFVEVDSWGLYLLTEELDNVGQPVSIAFG